jgi:hypothetical protein
VSALADQSVGRPQPDGPDGPPARPPRAAPAEIVATGVLAVAAAVCAALGVPGARAVGGLLLVLLLPGHLAVLALAPELAPLGRRMGLVLAVTGSLVAAMAAGLASAAATGLDRVPVAAGLGAASALLAVTGLWRARPPRVEGTANPPPEEPAAAPSAASARRRRWRWLGVVPVALGVAVAVAFGAGAVRDAERAAPGFTELALERRGTGMVAVATSHEPAPAELRYEIIDAGRPLGSVPLMLRPGERRELPLPSPATGALEVRLYRPGQLEPYRRVSLPAP